MTSYYYGTNGPDFYFAPYLDNWVMWGNAGNDTLGGNNLNDVIYGNNGNDVIYGQAGNDRIYGNNGNDILRGGSGNDTITGGGNDDYMDGGTGVDTVNYTYWNGGGTYNLATGVASFPGFYDEEIYNFENIWTGNGNDHVIGSSDNNFIWTSGGNDTVNGGNGNDSLYGGSGNDKLSGGTGDDVLIGGTGDDLLVGGSASDFLVGGHGKDTLIGEGFGLSSPHPMISITLYIPPDTLSGGNGADVFVLGDRMGSFYMAVGTGQYAEIIDFKRFEGDKILVYGSTHQLDNYSFNYNYHLGETTLYFKNTKIAEFDTLNVSSNDFVFYS